MDHACAMVSVVDRPAGRIAAASWCPCRRADDRQQQLPLRPAGRPQGEMIVMRNLQCAIELGRTNRPAAMAPATDLSCARHSSLAHACIAVSQSRTSNCSLSFVFRLHSCVLCCVRWRCCVPWIEDRVLSPACRKRIRRSFNTIREGAPQFVTSLRHLGEKSIYLL